MGLSALVRSISSTRNTPESPFLAEIGLKMAVIDPILDEIDLEIPVIDPTLVEISLEIALIDPGRDYSSAGLEHLPCSHQPMRSGGDQPEQCLECGDRLLPH